MTTQNAATGTIRRTGAAATAPAGGLQGGGGMSGAQHLATVPAQVAQLAGGLEPPTGKVAGLAAELPSADGGRVQAGTRGWWRAWRARFGLAEAFGTVGAVAGFAAGYRATGTLFTAAGLATVGEVIGFYGCVGTRTVLAACRATADLAGWDRLAWGAWHAVTRQLASCAAAEALDFFLIRPGCLAGAAWLLRGLPGGVWLGFAAGKAVADLAWYGMEALVRRSLARSIAARTGLGHPQTLM